MLTDTLMLSGILITGRPILIRYIDCHADYHHSLAAFLHRKVRSGKVAVEHGVHRELHQLPHHGRHGGRRRRPRRTPIGRHSGACLLRSCKNN